MPTRPVCRVARPAPATFGSLAAVPHRPVVVRAVLSAALGAMLWAVVVGAPAAAAGVTSSPGGTGGGSAPPATSGVGGTVPDNIPMQVPLPLEASTGALPPLIPIPAGCSVPPAPTAIFEGQLVANSSTEARFRVTRTRAGSLRGHAVGNLVDVLYVQETRFLRLGQRYVVGVGTSKGRLVSRVREPQPKFGGDAVIGVNDTDTPCPVVRDPIRTLLADGSPVESGTFSEMTSDRLRLGQAVIGPLLIGLLVLGGLAALKHLLFATGRGIRGVMDHEAEVMRIREAPTRASR